MESAAPESAGIGEEGGGGDACHGATSRAPLVSALRAPGRRAEGGREGGRQGGVRRGGAGGGGERRGEGSGENGTEGEGARAMKESEERPGGRGEAVAAAAASGAAGGGWGWGGEAAAAGRRDQGARQQLCGPNLGSWTEASPASSCHQLYLCRPALHSW